MHPYLFNISTLKVSTYEVALSVSFIIAIFLTWRRAPKEELDRGLILDVCLWLIIGGLLGARLLFILTNLKIYFADPIKLLKLWEGGMVYYGGFLGGVLAVFLVLRRRKHPFLPVADIMMPYLMLGYAIHRAFGCFLGAGCCFGAPTALPWGVTYPSVISWEVGAKIEYYMPAAVQAYGPGVHVHPTQLYESLFGLIWFFFLIWYRNRKRVQGEIFGLLLILYSLNRFFVEFFRGDSIRGFLIQYVDDQGKKVGILSTSQLISILLIIAGVSLIINRRKKGVPLLAEAGSSQPPPRENNTENGEPPPLGNPPDPPPPAHPK